MLRWKTIKPEDGINLVERTWYKTERQLGRKSAFINADAYGPICGKRRIELQRGNILNLSIHSSRGTSEHAKKYPFQLLIRDNTGMPNAHVYVKSVKEGKQIAEKIVSKASRLCS